MVLDVQNVGRCAQPLITGQQRAPILARAVKDLSSGEMGVAEYIGTHQPQPPRQPEQHTIGGKPGRINRALDGILNHFAYSIAASITNALFEARPWPILRGRAMKEEQVTFLSGELTLEGMIAKSGSHVERGAVMCHPHPLYGGSMFNNVVEGALEAMWRLGWATLRFNFRGVGQSTGEHGGGIGEADDAAAAVRFLSEELATSPQTIVLGGYSFGAMAAMNAASKVHEPAALILIALPLRMAPAGVLEQLNAPVILAAGDHDDYCPRVQFQALHETLGKRSQLAIIQGADHFFGGYEADLANALEGMIRNI